MKTQTKHLMLSVAIMLFIVFISIPIAFLKIERLYPIMTWSCRLDCIYFFVALGIYIATYKPKERMQKAKKTMKHDYSYDTKEVDTINQRLRKNLNLRLVMIDYMMKQ